VKFAKLSDPRDAPHERVMVFEVTSPLRLLSVRGEPTLGRFAEDLARKLGEPVALTFHVPTAARLTCEAGYDGWISEDAYRPYHHDGSDVMLCHPSRHLRLVEVRQVGRARRRQPARANPRSGTVLATTTLPVGTMVYHGTCSPERFTMPQRRSWFSTDVLTARGFSATCRDGTVHRRIMELEVVGSPRLLLVEGEPAYPSFAQDLAVKLGSRTILMLDPDAAARLTCEAGYDGWISMDAYAAGVPDILLCHPERWLRPVRTRWLTTGRVVPARANPHRRRP
jgi:hypothetical protein